MAIEDMASDSRWSCAACPGWPNVGASGKKEDKHGKVGDRTKGCKKVSLAPRSASWATIVTFKTWGGPCWALLTRCGALQYILGVCPCGSKVLQAAAAPQHSSAYYGQASAARRFYQAAATPRCLPAELPTTGIPAGRLRDGCCGSQDAAACVSRSVSLRAALKLW